MPVESARFLELDCSLRSGGSGFGRRKSGRSIGRSTFSWLLSLTPAETVVRPVTAVTTIASVTAIASVSAIDNQMKGSNKTESECDLPAVVWAMVMVMMVRTKEEALVYFFAISRGSRCSLSGNGILRIRPSQGNGHEHKLLDNKHLVSF